jgi:hypothetical protein
MGVRYGTGRAIRFAILRKSNPAEYDYEYLDGLCFCEEQPSFVRWFSILFRHNAAAAGLKYGVAPCDDGLSNYVRGYVERMMDEFDFEQYGCAYIMIFRLALCCILELLEVDFRDGSHVIIDSSNHRYGIEHLPAAAVRALCEAEIRCSSRDDKGRPTGDNDEFLEGHNDAVRDLSLDDDDIGDLIDNVMEPHELYYRKLYSVDGKYDCPSFRAGLSRYLTNNNV